MTLARMPCRSGCWVVLALLLVHLVFMGSPLHDASAGAEPIGAHSAHRQGGHAEPGASSLALLGVDQDNHCAIEWTPAPPTIRTGAPSGVLHLNGILADPFCPPVALGRSSDPPPRADAQALLQVFRI